MSQRSFAQVEKAFGLPRATLPLICRSTGMEYFKLGFDGQEGGRQSLPSTVGKSSQTSSQQAKQAEADFQKRS